MDLFRASSPGARHLRSTYRRRAMPVRIAGPVRVATVDPHGRLGGIGRRAVEFDGELFGTGQDGMDVRDDRVDASSGDRGHREEYDTAEPRGERGVVHISAAPPPRFRSGEGIPQKGRAEEWRPVIRRRCGVVASKEPPFPRGDIGLRRRIRVVRGVFGPVRSVHEAHLVHVAAQSMERLCGGRRVRHVGNRAGPPIRRIRSRRMVQESERSGMGYARRRRPVHIDGPGGTMEILPVSRRFRVGPGEGGGGLRGGIRAVGLSVQGVGRGERGRSRDGRVGEHGKRQR
mmetsp:Transcript_54176/g.162207  ORF Transcript_54176/g.162207 Transcript_54176/m.162207 type:complete len:287 (+) Transcript_54176:161-1021(+)